MRNADTVMIGVQTPIVMVMLMVMTGGPARREEM